MEPAGWILSAADAAASAEGIPAAVFRGLIERESAWNPAAVSAAGAVGLTQVMPWWASTPAGRSLTGIETAEDLKDPQKNLRAGARILASEIRRFGGSVPLALMAYNAGATAVNRARARAQSSDPLAVEPHLPAETRAYWRAVLTWGAAWAGKISRARASVEVKAGEISSEVLTFAGSPTGRAVGLILLVAAVAGLVMVRGR